MLTVETIGNQSRIKPHTLLYPQSDDFVDSLGCGINIGYKVVRVIKVGDESIRVSAICSNNHRIIYPTNGSIVHSDIGFMYCFTYANDAYYFAENLMGYGTITEIWRCDLYNSFPCNFALFHPLTERIVPYSEELMREFWGGKMVDSSHIVYLPDGIIVCDALLMKSTMRRYGYNNTEVLGHE